MLKFIRALFIFFALYPLLPAMPVCASDYHLGIDLGVSYNSHHNYLDHGKGYLQLTLARALDSSPMVTAAIGYRPDYFEHAALFGIWFKDRDDAFANAIPLIYQVLLEPKSEGDLYWAGASADLFVGKALFSAVAAYFRHGDYYESLLNEKVDQATRFSIGLRANFSDRVTFSY